jgi:hypothetical protein
MEALIKEAINCSNESKKVARTFRDRFEAKGAAADITHAEILREPKITREVISSIAGTPVRRNTQNQSIDLRVSGIFTRYISLMHTIDSEADSIREYYNESYTSLLSYTLVHFPFRQKKGKPRLIVYARSANWKTLARSEYDIIDDRQASMDETGIAYQEVFKKDAILHPQSEELLKMWKNEARRKNANVYIAYHLSEMINGDDMILSVIDEIKNDLQRPLPANKETPLVILSRKEMSGWYPGEVPRKIVDELMSSYNALKRKGLHGKTGC